MSAAAAVSSFLSSGSGTPQASGGNTLAGLAASYLGVSSRDAQAAPTPTPARKVARFISAEAAKSKLELADGKLPELHLREGNKKSKKDTDVKSKTVNPLLMFGALALSVVFSIMLVVVDFSPRDRSAVKGKMSARTQIKKKYFADQDMYTNPKTAEPLKPYQLLLREAHQAYSSGDYATERRCYRKVSEMLHEERSDFARGLTGSAERDRKLEGHINVLLQKG